MRSTLNTLFLWSALTAFYITPLNLSAQSAHQATIDGLLNSEWIITTSEKKLRNTLLELNYNPSLHPGHTDRKSGKWDTNHLRREEWTSGFFAGTMWYLFQITGNHDWRELALEWTHDLERAADIRGDHDTGFRIYSSYGNAYKLLGKREHYRMILHAASVLSLRYDSRIGAIKSWDWMSDRNFPVIIDNLMNLELLFEAARLSGNRDWYNMALSHADVSLTHHMREDGSTYHIVDFDDQGNPLDKFTTQGCNRTSPGCGEFNVWSRGQAWAIYGFAMIYRYTGEKRFLHASEKAAEYFMKHLPEDFVPPYDFFEPVPSVRTKDASASAITASALLELYTLTNNRYYVDSALNILTSLSSQTYLSSSDEISSLLKYSTRHRGEGNVGTSYADYYFIEAFVRYLDIIGYQFPEIPKEVSFLLEQNYPNPFSGSTNIYYEMAEAGLVKIDLFDINGRWIKNLFHSSLESGSHIIPLTVSGLPSGVYLYSLTANGRRISRKMTLINTF